MLINEWFVSGFFKLQVPGQLCSLCFQHGCIIELDTRPKDAAWHICFLFFFLISSFTSSECGPLNMSSSVAPPVNSNSSTLSSTKGKFYKYKTSIDQKFIKERVIIYGLHILRCHEFYRRLLKNHGGLWEKLLLGCMKIFCYNIVSGQNWKQS